jgi:hypothetical protein
MFFGVNLIWLPMYAWFPWADRHGEAGVVGWILGLVLVAPYWGFAFVWSCERLFVIGELVLDVDRARFRVSEDSKTEAFEIDLTKPFTIGEQWSPPTMFRYARIQLHLTQGDADVYLWWNVISSARTARRYARVPRVDEMRGYFIGRWLPAAEVVARLMTAKKRTAS